ncbi:MAG: proline dehydrogenase family protein [Candidatus Velamenicoccus archaeovorus]
MNGPLLRAPVLWVAHARPFRWLATRTPVGRAVAYRFVAGEDLDAAVATCRELQAQGIGAVLDHLGENVTAPEQAAEAAASYVRALHRIGSEGDLDAYISVKLTQLGLDFSVELCTSHVGQVLEAARQAGRLVMIDMESSVYVDRTLAVFRDLRSRHDHVGVCLQSYLRRTPADVDALPAGSIVRLVKGAYLEPPELALGSRREVDAAFARLAATLLARGHTLHVATHDPRLISGAERFAQRRGIPAGRIEYQMLYGVRRDLQARLARDGRPVRVYVAYGTEWYPYLTRRLAERPANMWFFLSNLVRVWR